MNILQSIIRYKCPRCREGDLFKSPFEFRKPLDMYKQCRVCSLPFEPEPGYYFGAMFVSYLLAVFTMLPLAGFCIIYLGMSVMGMMSLIIFLSIITFFKVLRLSRSIWIHANVKYDPHFLPKNNIIELDTLDAIRADKNVVILDATAPKIGQKPIPPSEVNQCIPGAIFFDIKNVFSDQNAHLPNTAPSPLDFEREAQNLGINSSTRIVIYDRHGIYSAPRAWWLFRLMGHENVSVLNGGLSAWLEAGRLVTREFRKPGKLGKFTARFRPDLLVSREDIIRDMDDGQLTILDARSEARFLKKVPEPREGIRPGHIPGSYNLPWTKLIEKNSYKPKEELEKIFSQYPTNKQWIASCGSGMTACVIALGASIVGYDDVAVYDGSWTEWGGDVDCPIE